MQRQMLQSSVFHTEPSSQPLLRTHKTCRSPGMHAIRVQKELLPSSEHPHQLQSTSQREPGTHIASSGKLSKGPATAVSLVEWQQHSQFKQAISVQAPFPPRQVHQLHSTRHREPSLHSALSTCTSTICCSGPS
ncbi:hypothetical protein E2C01_006952 [Portunus trituberculatus]|uniref:Uncharacterized protein n=1 Tax=Portunus trituberculatus TaxID=210409 RepID=A0A5B7D370_PORTR|nr:hypothetical protein [Portunus trituberculatus]